MGSACRCTTFQVPSSGLKIIVTGRANGAISSLPLTLAFARSIHNVGKLGSYVPPYVLNTDDLAALCELR